MLEGFAFPIPYLNNGLDILVSPALGAAELEHRIDFFGEGCLSGASFRAILFGVEAEGPGREWGVFNHSLEGRARARMVLGPFAETNSLALRLPKGRRGRHPAIKIMFICHPEPAAKDLFV
jgi:hypothetical protein